jgi:hypothetical protein
MPTYLISVGNLTKPLYVEKKEYEWKEAPKRENYTTRLSLSITYDKEKVDFNKVPIDDDRDSLKYSIAKTVVRALNNSRAYETLVRALNNSIAYESLKLESRVPTKNISTLWNDIKLAIRGSSYNNDTDGDSQLYAATNATTRFTFIGKGIAIINGSLTISPDEVSLLNVSSLKVYKMYVVVARNRSSEDYILCIMEGIRAKGIYRRGIEEETVYFTKTLIQDTEAIERQQGTY